MVRKCIHREIGLEYAVKIINMTADEAVQYSVAAEIDVFRHLPPPTSTSVCTDICTKQRAVYSRWKHTSKLQRNCVSSCSLPPRPL